MSPEKGYTTASTPGRLIAVHQPRLDASQGELVGVLDQENHLLVAAQFVPQTPEKLWDLIIWMSGYRRVSEWVGEIGGGHRAEVEPLD